MGNLFQNNCSIYRVAKTDLYAAIPHAYLRSIREYVMEYNGLELVPADKAVTGILFKRGLQKQFELAENGMERPISISSLQFETEEAA